MRGQARWGAVLGVAIAALLLAEGCFSQAHAPREANVLDAGGGLFPGDAGRRHVHRDAGLQPTGLDAGWFCHGAPGLPGPPILELGDTSTGTLAADLNGDGWPDLVSVVHSRVDVRLGVGKGAFGQPLSSQLYFSPSAFALADFNGDGIEDLAGLGSNVVGAYLGNGDGTFRPARTFAVSGSSLLAGDINRDGRVDLVVISSAGITALLGRGDGSFTLVPSTTGLVSLPRPVLADFNHDGFLDIASTAGVSLGLGNGTFGPTVGLSRPVQGSGSVAAGDLDGDGNVDLVVGDTVDGLAVYLGRGTGAFSSPVLFPTQRSSPANAVALADLDGDGHLDVVIGDGLNSVGLFRGRGDGGLGPEASYPVGLWQRGVLAADVDGDGHADVVVMGPGRLPASDRTEFDDVAIVLGRGDGTMRAEALSFAGNGPTAFVVADLNGDGRADVAAANGSANNASVLLGQLDGGLGTPIYSPAGNQPRAIASDDFDGDGRADLAVANVGDGSVSVLLGHGDGSFAPAVAVPIPAGPWGLLVGDIDDDGFPDLLVGAEPRNTLLRGEGDGGFLPTEPLALPSFPSMLGDLNGDGSLDALTYTGVFVGHGDGTFEPGRFFFDLELAGVGDFNEDGVADIAFVKAGGIQVALSPLGSGMYWPISLDANQDALPRYSALVVADFNGDGHLDVAATGATSSVVELYLGHGDGGFEQRRRYPVGPAGAFLHAGDVNGDGRMDLVVSTPGDDVGVLLNTGCY